MMDFVLDGSADLLWLSHTFGRCSGGYDGVLKLISVFSKSSPGPL